MIRKTISGAQVGADIAGLRASRRYGILTGGYVTKGCKTKKGYCPYLIKEFGLIELETEDYPERTRLNVKESYGTIRFAHNFFSPGELCTLKWLRQYQKPYLDVPIHDNLPKNLFSINPADAADWVKNKRIYVLNVAGNADERIEPWVEEFLGQMFRKLGFVAGC